MAQAQLTEASPVGNQAEANLALWQQRPLRVLQIHNFYQQIGGEDVVVRHEAQLLQQAGVSLFCWYVQSKDIQPAGIWHKIRLALNLLWNRQAQQQLQQRLAQEPVDLIHVHNSFPLLSPAIMHRAKQLGIPVVMTVHNFRMLHPRGFFIQQDFSADELRAQAGAGEASVSTPLPVRRFRAGFALRYLGQPWYRASRSLTCWLVLFIELHKLLGSLRWCQQLICPSAFVKNLLTDAGLAPEQLRLKPHSMALPAAICKTTPGHYVLFVGRADPAKGLLVLLQAWQHLDYPLWLVGVDEADVATWPGYQPAAQVKFLGFQPPAALADIYRQAAFLVVPSLCAETFGNVVVEAFAQGTPGVVSALGALPELVNASAPSAADTDDRCGLTFMPGNADDLRRQCQQLLSQPAWLAELSVNAFARYQQRYLPSDNQQALLRCYQDVLASHAAIV